MASRTDAAQVLDWMTAHGRAESALIWIRRQNEACRTIRPSVRRRARCLAALDDWAHLRDDQRASVWPGHESARLMWLARASLELGSRSDACAAWHQAVAACVEPADFAQLEEAVASFPASTDWGEEKAEVWTALANRFPSQEWPLHALLAYQLGRGDLAAAQAVAERLAELTPDRCHPGGNCRFDRPPARLRDGTGRRRFAAMGAGGAG